MRYWLTTHWPSRVDDHDDVAAGVWLPDGRERAGDKLEKGDVVFIYEARSGRTKIARDVAGVERRVPCRPGREGVVAVGIAKGPIAAHSDSEPERYADGTSLWWRWHAPLELVSRSGFVPRAMVNEILHYDSAYVLRGFGQAKSGLGLLSEDDGEALLAAFRGTAPIELPRLPVIARFREGPGGSGIESPEHLQLKEYIAADPAAALGESGLRTEAVEYDFPTGDRADVVLSDGVGRIVGLEVEVGVGDHDWEGPLQAIKYRRMLEPLTGRHHGDSRAVLAAYSISERMRETCGRYQIECFMVERQRVQEWARTRSGAKCEALR